MKTNKYLEANEWFVAAIDELFNKEMGWLVASKKSQDAIKSLCFTQREKTQNQEIEIYSISSDDENEENFDQNKYTNSELTPNDDAQNIVNLGYRGQKNAFEKGQHAERIDVISKTFFRAIRRYLSEVL